MSSLFFSVPLHLLTKFIHIMFNFYKFSKYFYYEEFFASSTAVAKGITNCPSTPAECAAVCHNSFLTLSICHLARKRLGAPLTISSGYRCAALNRAVGGVSNSYHLTGAAADLVCADMRKLGEVLETLQREFASENAAYNFRIIREKVVKGVPSWYHIQLEKPFESKPIVL